MGEAVNSRAKRLYVISYDISDNRKRSKAAETLKDYGCRVQKSVFECRIENKTLRELKEMLSQIIDPRTDSVRGYLLCENCRPQIWAIGNDAAQADDEEFCIL